MTPNMTKATLLILLSLGILQLDAQVMLLPIISDSLKKDASVVIREQIISYEIESPSEGVYKIKQSITILKPESKANIIRVFYDPDTPISHLSANVYDYLGLPVKKFKKDDFQDLAAIDGFSIYQDNRYKRLEINGMNYPFTLEWEYEQKIKGMQLVFMPDWDIQDFDEAVQKAQLTVKLPKSMNLLYQSKNIKLEPSIKTESDSKSYSWSVSNLRAIQEESYAPDESLILPQVQLALDTFVVEKIPGSMRSWKSFGVFLSKLYEGTDVLPEELVAQLQPKLAALTTRQEKIAFLYRYLQDNMRYVSVQLGIGGWKPFPASYVYKNKYGDCKALSNFMRSLLKLANIKAYNVSIQNGDVPHPIESKGAPNPRFNHMILYVPDEKIWLECTSNTDPPNFIGASNANRQVMLVTENGGQIINTPNYPKQFNQETWQADIAIQPDGMGILKAHTDYQGSRQEFPRALADQLNAVDRRKYFLEKTDFSISRLDSLDITASRETPTAKMTLKANLGRLGSRSGKRLFVPFNPLNPLTKVPAKMDNRHQPVIVRKGYIQENRLVFQLPTGFSIETLPFTEKKIESEFGVYTVSVKELGNQQIAVSRKLEVNATEQPAAKYADMVNFYRDVSKWDAVKMVLISQ